MNIRVFVLIGILLSFCVEGAAQNTRPEGSWVQPLETSFSAWKGDSLTLSFSCRVPKHLKNSQSFHVIPTYVSRKDTVHFPILGFYTRSGEKFRIRRNAFCHEKKTEERMLVLNGKVDSVDYRESMIVPSSMMGEVILQYVLVECCSSRPLALEHISVPRHTAIDTCEKIRTSYPNGQVDIPLLEANMTFIRPEQELHKERVATISIHATYPQNQSRLFTDFENNKAELERVDSFFAPMAKDTVTYQLNAISIVGYASVEGTWEYNERLSKKRAANFRDYLSELYGVPHRIMTVEGKGEDWSGLRKMVEQSKMPKKEEVLRIMESYAVEEGREKRMMELHRGEIYNYMSNNFFPSLRRMEAVIRYQVRPFKADEAVSVIRNRPQDLSLREIYDVARARNNDEIIWSDRDNYGVEYDMAASYFPESDIANINASSAALLRGDLEKAWAYLERVKDNPEAANNLGVYYWLCNSISEAESCFQKAKIADPERAAYNLEQLARWKMRICK